MLRLGSLLLKKRSSRLRKEYASLPSAAVGKKWNRIGQYTDAQRRDASDGAWRDHAEVTLVDATMQRPPTSDTGRGTDARSPPTDVLQFTTREEAEEFFTELEVQAASEKNVPVLELANHFYNDLAATADAELQEAGGEEGTKTDAERQEEQREVQRQFFADFYISQGVITPSQRLQFLTIMQRPPKSFVMSDPTLVLTRCVLRQQLESHWCSAAAGDRAPLLFRPVQWRDGVFEVFGQQDSSQVVVSQTPLPLLEPSSSDPPATALDVSSADEADRLAALLMEDSTMSPPSSDADVPTNTIAQHADLNSIPQGEEQETDSVIISATEGDGITTTASSPQLSLVHLHWLQRVISSGAAIDSDFIGLMLPMLLNVQPRSTVLHWNWDGGHGSRRISRLLDGGFGDYAKDIIAYAHHLHWTDVHGEAGFRSYADFPCVLQVNLCPSRKDKKKGDGSDDEGMDELLGASGTVTHDKEYTDRDSCPHTVRVTMEYSRRVTASSILKALVPECLPATRILRIHGLLVCPITSNDGVRPRVLLASDDSAMGRSPMNYAMQSVQDAASYAPSLIRSLYTAMEVAIEGQRGGNGGGMTTRVVYSVHSMNPVECEAVVGAALTKLRTRYDESGASGIRVHPISISDALGLKTEGTADDAAAAARTLFEGMESGWGNGLRTWYGIEGGHTVTDADAIPEAIREAVASSSWRFRPARDGVDGGFVCVLEITFSGGGSREAVPDSNALETKSKNSPNLFSHVMASYEGLTMGCCDAQRQHVVLAGDGAMEMVQRRLSAPMPSSRCDIHVKELSYGISLGRYGASSTSPYSMWSGCHRFSGTVEGAWLAVAAAASKKQNHNDDTTAMGHSFVGLQTLGVSADFMLALTYLKRLSYHKITRHVMYALKSNSSGDVSLSSRLTSLELIVEAAQAACEHGGGCLALQPLISDETHPQLPPLIATDLKQLVLMVEVTDCGDKAFVLSVIPSALNLRSLAEERVVAVRDALTYVLRRSSRLPVDRDALLSRWCLGGSDEGLRDGDERAPRRRLNRSHHHQQRRRTTPLIEHQHKDRLSRIHRRVRRQGESVEALEGDGQARDWQAELDAARHPRPSEER